MAFFFTTGYSTLLQHKIYKLGANYVQIAQKLIDFVPMSAYNDKCLHVLGKIIKRLGAQKYRDRKMSASCNKVIHTRRMPI